MSNSTATTTTGSSDTKMAPTANSSVTANQSSAAASGNVIQCAEYFLSHFKALVSVGLAGAAAPTDFLKD